MVYSAATQFRSMVRSNGISKDDKDHRGRWKNSTRISDGYDDVQLDFVDAKVAAVLCPGGVCNYAVKDPACTKEWITTHVTPNITSVFGMEFGYLLGRALFWLTYSQQGNIMPPQMRTHIQEQYELFWTVPQDVNPIKKDWLLLRENKLLCTWKKLKWSLMTLLELLQALLPWSRQNKLVGLMVWEANQIVNYCSPSYHRQLPCNGLLLHMETQWRTCEEPFGTKKGPLSL